VIRTAPRSTTTATMSESFGIIVIPQWTARCAPPGSSRQCRRAGLTEGKVFPYFVPRTELLSVALTRPISRDSVRSHIEQWCGLVVQPG
jgi:hypothetical protein